MSRQCGSNLDQIWMGKFLFTLMSHAMKLFLNVSIARSAEFCLWRWGGRKLEASVSHSHKFLQDCWALVVEVVHFWC